MKKYWLLASLLFCADSFARAGEDLVIWNGGISREDRESAPTVGTRLMFFTQEGHLVSDVKVLVKDSDGVDVVNMDTQGPWLLLRLPKGRYSVHATWQDTEPQGSRIDVNESRQEFGYMFRTK
jgi:hypothetical protein